MPVYEWGCTACGCEGEYFSTISSRHRTPVCEACGSKTKQIISAVAGVVRFPAAGGREYVSPASGKYITTERARREDLKRTGSRPYEGFEAESKEAKRRVAEDEKKSDAKLDDNVRKAYHSLSPTKRRHLGG